MISPPFRIKTKAYDSFNLPQLKISVHNANGQLIEDAYDIQNPILRMVPFIWWGSTFHMKVRFLGTFPLFTIDIAFSIFAGLFFFNIFFSLQTPLENIEQGTYIMIGFYHLASDASAGKPSLVSWNKLDINLDTIDTKKLKLMMHKPPIHLDARSTASDKDATLDDTCLVAEVLLSRKITSFSMEAVRSYRNISVPSTWESPVQEATGKVQEISEIVKKN